MCVTAHVVKVSKHSSAHDDVSMSNSDQHDGGVLGGSGQGSVSRPIRPFMVEGRRMACIHRTVREVATCRSTQVAWAGVEMSEVLAAEVLRMVCTVGMLVMWMYRSALIC